MARTVYVPEIGRALRFADGTTDQQITAYVRSKYAPAPAPIPEEAGIGALESGFYGSLGRAEAAGGKAAQGLGLDWLAQDLFDRARANEEYAAKYKPAISDISQVQGIGDVASFAGSTIAQSAPETAVGLAGAYAGATAGASIGSVVPGVGTVAGGIVGGLIGGAISALPFFVGGNLQRQAQEQGKTLEETSGYDATVTAAAQAPLDAAFEVLIARKFPGGGAALDVARKGFFKEVASTAAKGAATEALTEPAQQALELAQANPEKLLEFGPDVQNEILNAAAGGVLAGGVIGGAAVPVSRAVEGYAAGKQRDKEKQIQRDYMADATRGEQMKKAAEINAGIESLSAQPTLGALNLRKVRIEPTPSNGLTEAIERFQIVDPKGSTVAEFSDAVNAADAVSNYNKITGKKITLQNEITGANVPVTVGASQVPKLLPIKIGKRRFKTIEAATAEYNKLKGDVDFLEKYSMNKESLAKEAAARKTTPQAYTNQVNNTLKAKRAALASMEGYFSSVQEPPKAEASVAPAPEEKVAESPFGEVLRKSKVFKTALGSQYAVHEDGGTTRFKTPHPGHDPKDVGLKPKSQKTFYIRPEDVYNIDIVAAQGLPGRVALAEYKPGVVAVKFIDGPSAGKFINGTQTKAFYQPEIGLAPLEIWNDGTGFHFGNKITEITDPPIEEAAASSTPEPIGVLALEDQTQRETADIVADEIAVGAAPEVAAEAAPETTAQVDEEIVNSEEQARVRKFIEDRKASVATGVRDALNRYNLKDVQTKFIPAFMDAMNRPKAQEGSEVLTGDKSIVTLATDIYDPSLTTEQMINKVIDTLNHESIHSLFDLGLIRPAERQVLFNAASTAKVPGKKYTYLDYAKLVYDPKKPGLEIYENPELVVEEAVAEMFRDWRKRNAGAPPNTRGLFNRVIDALRHIFNTMRRNNYEDIFTQVEKGEVGLRERAAAERAAEEIAERKSIVPEMPKLSVAPVYPYGQRVPQVNASDTDRVISELEYGAIVTKISDLFGSKTLSFIPDRYKPSNEAITDFIRKWADKILPVGQMIDYVKQNGGTVPDALDTYAKAQLSQSITANNLEARETDLYRPLIEYIRDNGISVGDLGRYLYALHAQERNARIRAITEQKLDENGNPIPFDPAFGSGMSGATAEQIIRAVESGPKAAAYARAEQMTRKIIDDTNQLRVDSGLTPDFETMPITIQTEDGRTVTLEPYKKYVPLRGFEDESALDGDMSDDFKARIGQGFKIKGREDLRAFGRTSEANNADILPHIMLQNQEAVVRAEKNKVGLSFLGLIEANPEIMENYGVEILTGQTKPMRKYVNSRGVVKNMVDPMYKNSNDVFVVKKDGIEIPIKIENRLLQKAMITNKSADSGSNAKFVKFLGTLNRFVAAMNTVYNPEFALVNFPRDLQQAALNLTQYEVNGLKSKVLRDALPAALGVHKILRDPTTQNDWSDWYKMFREDGGNTSGFYGYFSIDEQIRNIERLSMDPSGSKVARAKTAFNAIKKFMEDYNGAFENAVRLSVYKNMIEAGASRQKAAFIAKNITVNFDQRGEFGPVMNSLYLFYNASVQGTMTLLTAAARSSKVRKALGGLVVFGFLQDQINALMSQGDDDEEPLYDKLPDYKLENNIILMDPFGFTDKGYIAIPLAYGANSFVNLGRAMSRNMRGGYTTGEAATSMATTFIDAFNPVGGTESFLNFIVPTALDPVVALSLNMDYSGRRIYPEAFPGSIPKADSQTYFSSTSPAAVWVADILNSATGGSEYIPGAISVHPDTLEYVYDYILGATGATARRVVDTAMNDLPKVLQGDLSNLELNNIPVLRKVYGNVSERMSFEDYFDKVNHVLMRGEEFKFAIKEGDPNRVKQVRAKFADELKIYPAIKALSNRRNKLAAELRKVRENTKMPPEQKRRRQEVLQKQIEQITERVDQLYSKQIGSKYPGLFS